MQRLQAPWLCAALLAGAHAPLAHAQACHSESGGQVPVVVERRTDAGSSDAFRPEPVPPDAGARARVRATEPEGTASRLAAERAIIDVIRTAIARGHTNSALDAIARHARDFPRGRLSEERDGLRVIALARAGRRTEAVAAAERFRRAHPRSVLRPAIDAALQ